VYVADYQRIRRIAPGGTISTVAGTGAQGSGGDGGPATLATMTPLAVAGTADGSLYIVDDGRLRRVSPQGVIAAVPGVPPDIGSLAAAADSSLLLTEPAAQRVLRLAPDGALSVIAGT